MRDCLRRHSATPFIILKAQPSQAEAIKTINSTEMCCS